MPRFPDVMNLVAWLFALWLAAAVVMLVMYFWTSAVEFHWATVAYLGSTVLFSLLAFCAMGLDKRRAGTGKRRISEATLHTFELLGGWPGSLLGQRTFRHKTSKLTYKAVFWGIVGVHLLLLGWMVYLWWYPLSPGTTEGSEPSSQPETSEEPLPKITPGSPNDE